MSDSAPALRDEHEPLADSDYDTILAAVMETARGRWFLHEYARRNRNADTGTVLAAIGRIEWLLQSREAATPAAVPIADAPAALPGILGPLRDIAENLIECGAPTYLCNELLQRIEELALARAGPAQSPTPAKAEPAVIADAAAIVAAEPPRDPFADILALSPEEKIALFT
jgi:hypothetical protein